jgi:hypothetical protein
VSRLRWDPTTRAYFERRLRDGKTRREATRCLTRYIARELYPLLMTAATQPPATLVTAA